MSRRKAKSGNSKPQNIECRRVESLRSVFFNIIFLTGSTGSTGFFHGFRLPAIANRSGEAGGDETVKTAFAYRRKSCDLLSTIGIAAVCLFIVHRSGDLTLAITISAKRIANTRFHPETGYLKNPTNPVNPV